MFCIWTILSTYKTYRMVIHIKEIDLENLIKMFSELPHESQGYVCGVTNGLFLAQELERNLKEKELDFEKIKMSG